MSHEKPQHGSLLNKITHFKNQITKLQDELEIYKLKYQEDKRKLKSTFESTGTAMLICDENRNILSANKKLQAVTGYPLEEMSKKKKWLDYIVPEDIDRLIAYDMKRKMDPSSVPDEYEFRIKDVHGKIRDLLVNVSIIPGTKNSLVSLLDITQRKKIEKKLKSKEKQYRELYENTHDLIFTIDLYGTFTSANKKVYSLLGYTEEDLYKTTVQDIVEKEFIPVVERHLQKKQQGLEDISCYELLIRSKQRTLIWVELIARLIRKDDKPFEIQAIARDITDRKRAEQKRMESEKRFGETADLLPGIIYELDINCNINYINKQGINEFGLSQQKIKNPLSFFSFIPENEHLRLKQDIKTILSGTLIPPQEYTMYKHDGSLMYVLIKSAPIIVEKDICGIRSCLLNITERKHIEEQFFFSEEKFRTIFEKSPIGMALFASNGTLIDRNQEFSRMFNLEEVAQIDLRKFNIFSDFSFSSDSIKQLKLNEVVHEDIEFYRHRRNTDQVGSACTDKRFYSITITSIDTNRKNFRMYLLQVEDITEKKLVERQKLEKAKKDVLKANARVVGLQKAYAQKSVFRDIITNNNKMKEILENLPQVAQSNANALITGESGTGKELIARALHDLGPRSLKPFVAVNCNALPDSLLESEFFGYKAGAFTDAKKNKLGKFELAHKGTLFLDEIGDISLVVQAKLLRAIEQKKIQALGDVKDTPVDVRIITATNKDLKKMVKMGQFREDLYYRIKVLHIELPPLRKRRTDIPLLCNHFIKICNMRYKKSIFTVSQEVLRLFNFYNFPGNIRELENAIEHAFVNCHDAVIALSHIPKEIRMSKRIQGNMKLHEQNLGTITQLQNKHILDVLIMTKGNKTQAAHELGIHKTTLLRKLKKLKFDENN